MFYSHIVTTYSLEHRLNHINNYIFYGIFTISFAVLAKLSKSLFFWLRNRLRHLGFMRLPFCGFPVSADSAPSPSFPVASRLWLPCVHEFGPVAVASRGFPYIFLASGEATLGTQRYFSKNFPVCFFACFRRGDSYITH